MARHQQIQGLILLMLIGMGFLLPIQCDLTTDERYTLSSTGKKQIDSLEESIKIDVFLAGKLPPTFQRLRAEIETVLGNMSRANPTLFIEYIDPFDTEDSRDQVIQEMQQYGLLAETIVDDKTQSIDQTVVFPWAILSNGRNSVRISLWQKNIGDLPQELFFRSVSQLEYQFLDGIKRLTLEEKQNLAVLTSHDTSEAALITDFLQSLKPYYNLASFDLKALPEEPKKTLDNLNRFDLLFVSNPKTEFTNQEKFILDQYQMKGGSILWTMDALALDRDSLFNTSGSAVTFPKTLNLDDYLFKQGLRLNSGLVSDLYCAPIVMAQGNNENTQYIPYPWTYYPIPSTSNKHPISKGVGNVWFRFATTIDTLPNGADKTVLTASSPLNKLIGTPAIISLKEATIPKNPENYQSRPYPLAVLVEGRYESVYANRIAPFKTAKLDSGDSKTILIADGNFAESQLDKGKPLALGYDKWTHNFYQNKALLKNAIHYLMGHSDWLEMRSRTIEITSIDSLKKEEFESTIKLLSLLIPGFVLAVLMLLFRFLRKRAIG